MVRHLLGEQAPRKGLAGSSPVPTVFLASEIIMKHSLKTGFSFGLTSGIITTLGLMVGLHYIGDWINKIFN